LGVKPHRPDKYGWGGIWGVPACEDLPHENPQRLLRWCWMCDSDISKNPPAKAGGRSKKGSSDSPAPWRAIERSRVRRGLIEGLLSTAHMERYPTPP